MTTRAWRSTSSTYRSSEAGWRRYSRLASRTEGKSADAPASAATAEDSRASVVSAELRMTMSAGVWSRRDDALVLDKADRKSTRLNSSHSQISYAVFCLKKKKKQTKHSSRQRTHL